MKFSTVATIFTLAARAYSSPIAVSSDATLAERDVELDDRALFGGVSLSPLVGQLTTNILNLNNVLLSVKGSDPVELVKNFNLVSSTLNATILALGGTSTVINPLDLIYLPTTLMTLLFQVGQLGVTLTNLLTSGTLTSQGTCTTVLSSVYQINNLLITLLKNLVGKIPLLNSVANIATGSAVSPLTQFTSMAVCPPS